MLDKVYLNYIIEIPNFAQATVLCPRSLTYLHLRDVRMFYVGTLLGNWHLDLHSLFQGSRVLKADISIVGTIATLKICRGKEWWWLGLGTLEAISLWTSAEWLRRCKNYCLYQNIGIAKNKGKETSAWMLTHGMLLQPAGVCQYQARSVGRQPRGRRGAPGWPDLDVSYGQTDDEALPILD